jgi:hypothetical protein
MTKAKEQKLAEHPQHIETASEKYRRLKNQQFDTFIDESFAGDALANVEQFVVKAPSGMEWACRKLTADFYAAAGTMPMHLANKVRSLGSEQEIAKQLTQDEQDRLMELSWKSLLFGCVEPRVVVTPTEANHVSIDDITMGDFQALTSGLISGGAGAERLETFR